MILFALGALVALAQGPAPELTATVDRVRLAVGEELTLTVRARTRGADPIELILPRIVGLAPVGTREETQVAFGAPGGAERITTRELVLRAERPGRHQIGAVVARQGGREVSTTPIEILVDSAGPAAPAGLGPVARALAEAAPPPAGNQVALSVLLSSDSAMVGEQVDVVAVAWFPRSLRARLRRSPVVTLPAGAGVWTLPQPTPEGVALTRRVGDQVFDLFVAHAILFPLAPGRVLLPPAEVSYALPLTFSFFSREERLTLTADTVGLTALPLPPGDAAATAAGVVGQDVAVAIDLSTAATRVGEPLDVTATVSGVGNVALWPEPVLQWPAGFRAYAASSIARVEVVGGRVRGTKTFRSAVVPDSSGRFVLPEVRYPFFEPAAGRYTAAVVPPRSVVVGVTAEPRAARARPALLPETEPGWADRAAAALPPERWLLLALVPPLVAWLRRRRGRRPDAPSAETPARELTRLGRLEREFQSILTNHVPDDRARFGGGLSQALRAAGIDGAVADHVARLRDRLRAVRYGPAGGGDGAELAAELEQVLRVLGGPLRRRSSGAGLAALVLLAVAAGAASAQALSAERLYEAGALRAAADSFAARAAAHPGVAAHWYDLGATLYRAGADGKAIAAWTLAARRAPRDPLVRRARALLPAPDPASAHLLAAGPLTPNEWLLVAGAAWLVGWGLVALRRGRRAAGAFLVLALVAVGAGAWEWQRRAQPVAVVLSSGTAVHAAPYGGAATTHTLDAGGAVLVGARYGRWLAVRRGDGLRGWVLDSDVVRL